MCSGGHTTDCIPWLSIKYPNHLKERQQQQQKKYLFTHGFKTTTIFIIFFFIFLWFYFCTFISLDFFFLFCWVLVFFLLLRCWISFPHFVAFTQFIPRARAQHTEPAVPSVRTLCCENTTNAVAHSYIQYIHIYIHKYIHIHRTCLCVNSQTARQTARVPFCLLWALLFKSALP